MASSTEGGRAENMSEGAMVRISAVICTLNRASYLVKAMESLVNQTYPKEYYEIIVVDNGSTDNTREVAEQFSQFARIRYIYEPVKGLSQARNTGWQAASGKYVAYLDDDAIACPHWLEKMMEAFETAEPRPASVGGKAVPLWESERPAWLEDRMLGAYAIVDWGDRARFLKPSSPEHHVGCNVAYSREVLEGCGGFNVNLGRKGRNLLSNDENLIRQYIDSHGLGIYYDPEIIVEHLVPKERLTRRFMLRRHFWQGVSDVVLWYEESSLTPGRLWLLVSGLEGLAWAGLYLIGFLLWSFFRRPLAVARDLSKIETARTYLFRSLYHPSCSLGQSSGYLQLGMGHLARGTGKGAALEQGPGTPSRPPPKNWNRITWWAYPYLMLKRSFFGIGGIFFLVIVGLYVSGALVEPLRWYLVGIASALLLLGGGVLVLSYIRLILNRLAMDQSAQVSNINKQISDIKSVIKKEVSGLSKELSVIKDDVFIIGYDILKEQNKLAEKVSQLETKAGNDKKTKHPPKKNIE
jgi:glycosyltransferase involved in cell wall biosynthesis